jgi:drug/metabolite transporter (DMT)-like permease
MRGMSAPDGATATLRAVLWMGGAVLSFSLMAISVRELVDSMGAFQILALRSLVTLALVLLVMPRYGVGVLRTRLLRLHVLRNLLHFAGQWLWVFAIAGLPLAMVFAIEYTLPVWTVVLAVILLGERLNPGRVVMLASGVLGMLIILRPGMLPVEPAALAMLLGALCYAGTSVATKRIAGSDAPIVVIFWMALIQLPLGLVPSLPAWVAPVWADAPWIALVGLAGSGAHYCMTRAFHLADASVVMPIDFLRLPLIAAVGALVYDEAFDPLLMVGAAVMFAGIWYSVRRETRAPRVAVKTV